MESTVESFRDIPGIPDYQVSDHGHIRFSPTGRLRALYERGGYETITIRKSVYNVHRLVMLAFVGTPPRGCTVDHIDRDGRNNRLSNLRYATAQEQRRNQTLRNNSNRPRRAVERISGAEIVTYASLLEAARDMGVHVGALWNALKGSGVYKGYSWRYLDTHFKGLWKDIPPQLVGGKTGYAASECGMIRFPNGRITAGVENHLGYLRVGINYHYHYVHRLIAQVYLPPAAHEEILVNHRDGIKTNNHVTNLEFVTYAGNRAHAIEIGLVPSKGRPVGQYTLRGEFVREHKSAHKAGRTLGKATSRIYLCCNGKIEAAYGFVWKYS